MFEKLNPENEAVAIIGIVTIAVIAMFMLGAEAKDIPLALGSGLVGYLTKSIKST